MGARLSTRHHKRSSHPLDHAGLGCEGDSVSIVDTVCAVRATAVSKGSTASRHAGPKPALRKSARFDTVALTGGVFQNKIFFEHVAISLREEGFRVISHRRVPANDGGLSLGQAAIAAARALKASSRVVPVSNQREWKLIDDPHADPTRSSRFLQMEAGV
jgi:hypothetical protein